MRQVISSATLGLYGVKWQAPSTIAGVRSRLALAALLAGAFAVAEGVTELFHTQSSGDFETTADYVLEAFFLGFLVAAALACFALRARAGSGIGAGAYVVLGGGFTLVAVSAAITLVSGKGEDEAPLGFLFLVGLLACLVALVVLLVESVRDRVWPRWFAPALLVALVVSLALGENAGALLLSVPWFALAAVEARGAGPRSAG
jgi:hypothetical protein